METLTIYPAPKANDGTNKTAWTPTEFLRKGEYDLVNISLIGFDPNTGWTFDQCSKAWDAAREELAAEERHLKWWMLRKQYRHRLRVSALWQRQGMGGFA